MTATLILSALLTMAADASGTFEFKDAAVYEKRPMLQYRAVEFRNTPVRPLGDERAFPSGTLYGVVPVGPKPETALTIVWLPEADGGPQLWLDANGDGRLADDERHAMKGRTLEVPATITAQFDPVKKIERTLIFRRSSLGDGLRYSVRGYEQGRLQLGETKHAALLIDGNANGCFDNVGQDRVWLDLNRNGRFDPLTEQFPLGKPISFGGQVYVVSCDAAASSVQAKLRSAGQGKVRLKLAKNLPKSKISAELISDLGELVVIDKLDEAIAVPYGQYRVSALKLETPDAGGETWTYSFYNDKTKNYSVPTNHETTVTLLDQLDLNVSFGYETTRPSPGQTLSIQPKLTADGTLYLSSCAVGGDANSRQAEGNAEIVLLSPDGKVVSRGMTGFS